MEPHLAARSVEFSDEGPEGREGRRCSQVRKSSSSVPTVPRAVGRAGVLT